MTADHIDRAAQTLSLAPWADLSITEQVRWLNAAGRLAEAGLLVTPEHDAAVAAEVLLEAADVFAKFAEVASVSQRRIGWDAARRVLLTMADEAGESGADA